ncbi:MAG: M15 family metallopeptidase [Bacteroidetes bacterium]|nr:M15 family metallopeptidase [Bacteroidota bacterium]
MPNKAFGTALILLVPILFGCQSHEPSHLDAPQLHDSVSAPDRSDVKQAKPLPTVSLTERSMLLAGLVDVKLYHPNIQVNLRYATTDNFLKQNIYGTINSAYMTKPCAQKLGHAQQILDSVHPGLNLLVWDAARPVRCQQLMWDAVDFPIEERVKYVSNPANRSLHNFGCAVDLTLTDSNGQQLDMGTGFDDFDTLAQPVYESRCLLSGALNEEQLTNRKILRSTMQKAGFRQLPSEWWHYNCCSREYASEHFSVVE